jgi:hypothetical protein
VVGGAEDDADVEGGAVLVDRTAEDGADDAVPDPRSADVHAASVSSASAAPASGSRRIYDAQSNVRVTAFFQSA